MTTEFARQDLAGNSSVPSPSENPERVRVIREGVASYLPDIDPDETGEWLESFDGLLARSGPARARYLMLRLLERANAGRVAIPALTSTDYVNTIPTENEPWFPGDEDTGAVFARGSAGMPRSWCTARSAQAWVWADTSRPMPPRPPSTRSVSTTSSGEMPTRAAATRYSSRATPPPASTPAPSWRAGSPPISWTDSARRRATPAAAYPPTRIRA